MTPPPVAPRREIRRDFGLDVGSFVRWPVGFESECWVADDRWLVKVWRDPDHPVDLAVPSALADAAYGRPPSVRTTSRCRGRCARSTWSSVCSDVRWATWPPGWSKRSIAPA